MSTSIRDFQGPELPDNQTQAHINFGEPTSPTIVPRHLSRDSRGGRRDSAASGASTTAGTARYRMRDRSNTVRTYHEPEHPNWQPGAEPGIDTTAKDDRLPAHLSNLKTKCDIRIIDFSPTEIREIEADNDSLPAHLSEERPDNLTCRWISVNGLSWDVIRCLGNRFNLHRLAIEDLIHTHTRTKVDWYADHAFIVLTLQKLVRLHRHRGRDDYCDCMDGSDSDSDEVDEKVEADTTSPAHRPHRKRSIFHKLRGMFQSTPRDVLPRYLDRDRDGKIDEFIQAHSGLSDTSPIKSIRTLHRYESAQIPEHTAFMEKHSALAAEDLTVSVEQVSLFLISDNTVISFFEHSADDIEQPIRDRLHSEETMLRRSCDASLMVQAIIDAIVDLAMPVRDAYNQSRKELQIDSMTNPDIKTSRALHIFGEEVDMLQNLFKPIVHLVNALRDHNTGVAQTHVPSIINLVPAPAPREEGEQYAHRHDSADQKEKLGGRDRPTAPLFNRQMSEFKRPNLKRPEVGSTVSITPLAHTYFGDVLDHCITIIQALEQMDASATNISTLIFNTVGAKTNNFMMILAVVTVFFAPLTFISGYFGMNFASGSGLDHPFAFFWVVAAPALVGFMLLVFATMLWENIKDFFAKRGIRAHRRNRRRAR